VRGGNDTARGRVGQALGTASRREATAARTPQVLVAACHGP